MKQKKRVQCACMYACQTKNPTLKIIHQQQEQKNARKRSSHAHAAAPPHNPSLSTQSCGIRHIAFKRARRRAHSFQK